MTRSDVRRDPARRLAGLHGRPRGGTAPPLPARLDPPTVPLPLAYSVAPRGGWEPPHPRREPDPPAPGTADGPDAVEDEEPDLDRHGARPPAWRRVAARWLPPSLAGARVDPGRPGAVLLVLVVLVGALVAGVGVWANRPTAQAVAGLPEVASPTAGAAGAAGPGPVPAVAATPGPLVVSVVGKVARPGLVRVPDGARVADAVDAAGGALPGVDLSVLNLARRLGDGEQIALGVPPAPDAAPVLPAPGAEPASGAEPGTSAGTGGSGPRSATGAAGPGAKVDLNRATEQDLDALPGIGPVTAAKILDWRSRNGRFSRVEQLREVDGIGETRFARLKDLVTV